MARGGVSPIVRYGVLVGLGWAGWNWAGSQPAGSWPQNLLAQGRTLVQRAQHPSASAPRASAPPSSSAPAPAAPPPPPPAAATAPLTMSWQFYQLHDDGLCWLDTGWSDGHIDSQQADPSKCRAMQATSLVDLGGFPLVWDPGRIRLRQDPAQGGTNLYGQGDVVQNAADGSLLSVSETDGGSLLSGRDGVFPVSQFFM